MNRKNSFPNQKSIGINREMPKGKDGRTYLAAYNDNILQAMRELSSSCFKVYMYLLMNKDGYEFFLSPSFIGEEIGLHKDTVRKGIYELQAKNYIKEIGKEALSFKETPFLPSVADLLPSYQNIGSNIKVNFVQPKTRQPKTADLYNLDDWV